MVESDWLFENYLSLNPTKCYCMFVGKNKDNDTVNFENISPTSNTEKVILDLANDNKLSFDNHVRKYIEKQVKRYLHYQKYQLI